MFNSRIKKKEPSLWELNLYISAPMQYASITIVNGHVITLIIATLINPTQNKKCFESSLISSKLATFLITVRSIMIIIWKITPTNKYVSIILPSPFIKRGVFFANKKERARRLNLYESYYRKYLLMTLMVIRVP